MFKYAFLTQIFPYSKPYNNCHNLTQFYVLLKHLGYKPLEIYLTLEIRPESISHCLALMFYDIVLYHILYLTLLVLCGLLVGNSSYVHLTKAILVS